MKIGIDVDCWINRRGHGRHTRELLGALMAVDRRNDYLLFASSHTVSEVEDVRRIGASRLITAETGHSPARAALGSGHRSIADLWTMRRAILDHHRDMDLFYFPAVHTYLPLAGRLKVVVTVHDVIAEHYPHLIFRNWRARALWMIKIRWATRRSSLVLTGSEATRQDIVSRFRLKQESVRVIPYAPGATFRPLADRADSRRALANYGIGGDQRFVLHVGGFNPYKNLIVLIDAFNSLTRERAVPDLKLVLVGSFEKGATNSDYPLLREKIATLGLTEKVIFTGYVSDAELVHFYNAADLLVLPSLCEGFGLTAVEAMACGTPVVASSNSALPEVIAEGGLFFNPRSSEELRARLEELLTDDDLREDLGHKALRRARVFSWERSAGAVLATFRELVTEE